MKKPAPPKDKERERLEADIATFLSKGGKITEIQKGISGYRNDKVGPGRKKAAAPPASDAKVAS